MRLDNRSKTVLVSGDALSSETGQNSVREWYESTGGSISVADDGGVLVTYPSREMAEKVSPTAGARITLFNTPAQRKLQQQTDIQALALGTSSIPNLSGPLKAVWHSTSSQPGSGYASGYETPTHEPQAENEVEMEDGERRERDSGRD